MPNQVDGVLVHSMSDYELSRVRTELYQLPILPTIPPHPVQPHGDSSRHRHLGNVSCSPHGQVRVPATPVRIATHCRLRCFSQQIAQQHVALLADVPEPLPARAGILRRNQPDIAAELLATWK